MGRRPTFSLIVPTRERVASLRRFLDSLLVTAAHPETIEVILVVDADDAASVAFRYDGLAVRQVVGPPGQTMGDLNTAGYEASTGAYVMLLNDDVVARTKGWDDLIRAQLRCFPDDIVLIHTNDTLMREHLCTFPLVSRTFCERIGGVCPREYVRYRIDDHLEDIFKLLGVLGEQRIVYMPDVVFEHFNFVEQFDGPNVYLSDPKILAVDAPKFEALFPHRKELALQLKEYIDERAASTVRADRQRTLAGIADSAVLHATKRLRVESAETTRSSANTRVTVGVLTADRTSKRGRLCLEAVRAHTANYELVVLDRQHSEDFHYPRELNRLLRAAQTDFVALLNDEGVVGSGWLDALLAATAANVGVVTPAQRPHGGDLYGGVAFHPDRSGQHGQLIPTLAKPHAVPTFCHPVLLLDRMKCRRLYFDEGYRHYFFDLDFGLRVWEANLHVVCAPGAVVTRFKTGPLPYGVEVTLEDFEPDRQAFCRSWMASGRLARLENEAWNNLPELRPVHLEHDVSFPAVRKRRVPSVLERAFERIRRKGIRGVAAAVQRRFLRLLSRAWRHLHPAPPRRTAEFPQHASR